MKTFEFRISVIVTNDDILEIKEQIEGEGILCSFNFAKKVLRDMTAHDAERFINEPKLFGFGYAFPGVSEFKERYNIKD